MTLPLRNFVAPGSSSDDDDSEEKTLDFLGQTTTTCLAFPGTFVSLFKRFLLQISMEPLSNTTTRIRTWAVPHRLSDLEESTGKEDERTQRDFANILAAIEEDWECVEWIQEGLSGTGRSEFIFGGYERNNARFLEHVGRTAEQLEALKKASNRKERTSS
jgi:Ring hydroxylating alpha subunit (catalytic domain)